MVWLYRQTSEIDCNIIGVCKEKYFVMEDEELSLFFPDERMRDKVEPYYRGYHEIAEFYRSFYGNDKMGKMTLFFLPDIGEDFGGVQAGRTDCVHCGEGRYSVCASPYCT